jgi:hypothetical protein
MQEKKYYYTYRIDEAKNQFLHPATIPELPHSIERGETLAETDRYDCSRSAPRQEAYISETTQMGT